MRKDKQPGINFEKVVLEKLNLEITPDYSFPKEGIKVDVSVKASIKLDKIQKRLRLSLEVSLFKKAENSPLRLSVLASGYFKAKDVKTLEEFSKIQASALVFPFIREIIANITMRTGYPPFLIPPTNIIDLVGKNLEKAKKQKTD